MTVDELKIERKLTKGILKDFERAFVHRYRIEPSKHDKKESTAAKDYLRFFQINQELEKKENELTLERFHKRQATLKLQQN